MLTSPLKTHTCTVGSWLSVLSHCPSDHLSSSVDTPAFSCRDPALGGEELALGVTLGDVGSSDRHTGPPLLTQGQRIVRKNGVVRRIGSGIIFAGGSWLSLRSKCPRDHFSNRSDTPALPCRVPALGGEELALVVTLGDVGFKEVGHTSPPLFTPSLRTIW